MTRVFGGLILFFALVLSVRAAQAVEVQRVTSPSGIEAWLVEDHTNPIVAMRFAFRGGAALDPGDKVGLAHMAASTLDEGAGDLDSQAFQGRLEDLSITLKFSADKDVFGGTVTTLSQNTDETFRLLGLALTQPRFDAEPVNRIRGQIEASLRSEAEDPNAVASKALAARLYPNHPYGRPAMGTLEGIAAVTAADLKQFAAERLARDNLVVGIVGDVTPARVKVLLETAFAVLPEHAKPWTVADVTPRTTAETQVIVKPVPQSVILLAQAGLKRDDPDFYTAYVMNHILGGGGFTSRLYNQVREVRGLAYSVGSYLYPMDHSALILVSAGTANARVAETLSVVREEWRKIVDQGVTDEELNDAKTYLTGSFPLRFSSSDRIARILVGMQLDNLGIDFLDRRNDQVQAVTRDAVNKLAATLLDTAHLVAVVVGQPEGLAGR